MSLMVDIKKTLGDFKLNVKFESNDGIMAILGASGCGKSMTLKCIAGIETPDEGRIVLDKRVLFDSRQKINLPPQQRRVGYLFQNYALFPNMTVEQNIGAGVKLPKKQKKEAVSEKIKMFYLAGLEKLRPGQLSGGQQQRVALARILASEPDIIMLDEPFSALDSYLKWQLEQELMDLLTAFKGTVLLVSHNRNEVYRFAHNIAVISDGKVEVVSEKKKLFRAPRTLSAALLTGCKNISRVERLTEHTLNAADWGIVLKLNKTIPDNIRLIGMRAHYFKYTETADTPNTITCDVLKVIENPFSYIIMLRNKDSSAENNYTKLRWEVDKNIWEEIAHKGSTVRLTLEEENMLLLS